MNSYPCGVMHALGLALALSALACMMVALSQSRSATLARQETQAWKHYALALKPLTQAAACGQSVNCEMVVAPSGRTPLQVDELPETHESGQRYRF